MKRNLLCLILALVMMAALVPLSVIPAAAAEDSATEESETEEMNAEEQEAVADLITENIPLFEDPYGIGDIELDIDLVKLETALEEMFGEAREEILSQPEFEDVSENDWSYEDIMYVSGLGFMNGTSETTFAPKNETTRAMIVTILWRLDGEKYLNYFMQFEDVPAGEWYTEAIRWATAEKIVTGYSDTKFGPNDPITREQLATILFRYAVYAEFDTEIDTETNFLSFNDVFDISEYAKEAMFWALQNELIKGSDGNLDPQGKATREQVAAILHRFVENVVTPEIEKALTELMSGIFGDMVSEEGEEKLGGWTETDEELTEEDLAVFNDAVKDVSDIALEPIKLLGTQVVAGINYKFLCNGTTENGTNEYLVIVWHDLEGGNTVTDIIPAD